MKEISVIYKKKNLHSIARTTYTERERDEQGDKVVYWFDLV